MKCRTFSQNPHMQEKSQQQLMNISRERMGKSMSEVATFAAHLSITESNFFFLTGKKYKMSLRVIKFKDTETEQAMPPKHTHTHTHTHCCTQTNRVSWLLL